MLIYTNRLILRPWKAEDLAPLIALNADPHVSEFFPAPVDKLQSEIAVQSYKRAYDRDGFGFMVAELAQTGAFAGIIGMQTMRLRLPQLPQPGVEIGWRLAYAYWGQGLAVEGARAVIDYAFNTLKLPSVVAITTVANFRSRRVMEKLSMTHRYDFNHPGMPEKHPLRRHVLYELMRSPSDKE